jgi:hypothetical protein
LFCPSQIQTNHYLYDAADEIECQTCVEDYVDQYFKLIVVYFSWTPRPLTFIQIE